MTPEEFYIWLARENYQANNCFCQIVKMVRKEEREACAKLVEEKGAIDPLITAQRIRERNE